MEKKKIGVILLASSMVAAMILSACGKQKVDYNMDESVQSDENSDGAVGTADGALAERLGIPKSYYGDIDVENSGLLKINISADHIYAPSTDSMKIEYLEKNTMDAAYKQKIAEMVFDRTDGIYQFDFRLDGDMIRSKHDIEQEIQLAQWYIDAAQEVGDQETVSAYEDILNELYQDYEDVTEEHDSPGDWSALEYIGDMNDIQYRLVFSPSDGTMGYFSYYMSYNGAELLYRPYRGAFNAIYWSTDAEAGENQCSWSEEEAVEMAKGFLNDCGISDVAVELVRDLEWEYMTIGQSSGEGVKEIDGYYICFVRAIDGNAIYCEETYAVDTLNEGAEIYEKYEVYIDDNGILEAYCYDMFHPTGQIEENVSLLSWKEILEMAETVIPEYYSAHETNYDTVTFNDVRLTYYLVNGEEENIYKYIPVWVFEEVDEYGCPSQLIMLDAITGQQIDINERKFGEIETVQEHHSRGLGN